MRFPGINPLLPSVFSGDAPVPRPAAGDVATGRPRVAEFDLADIYARRRQGLFTHALSITGCSERAEDAIHDAFVRLCSLDPAGIADPAAYVFTAVRSAAIDQLRRAKRSEVAGDPKPASIFQEKANGHDPYARALAGERAESVARAVETLPLDQREIIVLRVYAGLTFDQIAKVLNEPLPTIASRYRRTLERLKRQLEKLV
jgi:RNA polymerase sigma-70 factor (ECF subfamily)